MNCPEQVTEQKGEPRTIEERGALATNHRDMEWVLEAPDGHAAPATTVAQPEAEGGPRPEPVPSAPLCPVHQSLEDQGKLECEIGGNNCVACSLNERAELLALLAPLAARDGSEDSVSVLRRVVETQEVARCAQALLTALNVGDVHGESPLHLKLREVMIAYRSVCARAEPVPVGVEAAAIPPSTVEGEANDPM